MTILRTVKELLEIYLRLKENVIIMNEQIWTLNG